MHPQCAPATRARVTRDWEQGLSIFTDHARVIAGMGNKGSCCAEEQPNPFSLDTVAPARESSNGNDSTPKGRLDSAGLRVLVEFDGEYRTLRIPRQSLRSFADFDATLRGKLAPAGVPRVADLKIECFDSEFQVWVILGEENVLSFGEQASVKLRACHTSSAPPPAPACRWGW